MKLVLQQSSLRMGTSMPDILYLRSVNMFVGGNVDTFGSMTLHARSFGSALLARLWISL